MTSDYIRKRNWYNDRHPDLSLETEKVAQIAELNELLRQLIAVIEKKQ